MTKTHFHMEAGVAGGFRRHGLDTFEALMGGEPGELLSRASGREVRRLRLRGASAGGAAEESAEREAVFYLKRRVGEPLWRLAEALAFGRLPQSGAMREVTLLRKLRAAGFAAMEPVAWGEQRRWGVPVGGFVVVKNVAGRDVAAVFDQATPKDRHALMRELGGLMGRLHRAGFMHPVRLKDLILQDAPAGTPPVFVLIDRETGKPWTRTYRVKPSLEVIARAARRTLRDRHAINGACALAFVRGYRAAVGELWPVGARDAAACFAKALRAELGRTRRRDITRAQKRG